MNSFLSRFKFTTQRMSVNNPFHHDFALNDPKYYTSSNFLVVAFDLGRIVLYMAITLKLVMKAPSFILFKRTNFLNNPDYMLIANETEFNKLAEENK